MIKYSSSLSNAGCARFYGTFFQPSILRCVVETIADVIVVKFCLQLYLDHAR